MDEIPAKKVTKTAPTISDAKPVHHLVVIHPFDGYQRGALINNAAEIDAVMSSENAHHCHKVFPQ